MGAGRRAVLESRTCAGAELKEGSRRLRHGELSCWVAQQCAFDEAANGGCFVGVELAEGLEVAGPVLGDGAFFGVEDELVG